MANEQKMSKWWFWAFPALANLFLLVGIILLMAGRVSYWTLGYPPKPLYVAEDAFLRVARVLATWIYEPVRRAMGQGPRQFYSPFSIVFIWELMAFAGGLLCHKVGLLCHNVAGKPRRAPNGEGQQPRDRGQS